MPLPIGGNVSINRGVRLHEHNLAAGGMSQQFASHAQRFVLLSGGGAKQDIAVWQNESQCIEVFVAVAVFNLTLCVGIGTVEQDDFFQTGNRPPDSLRLQVAERQETEIDISGRNHDRPRCRRADQFARGANAPADKSVQQRAFSCPRATEHADDQNAIHVELEFSQSWRQARPQDPRFFERRGGGRGCKPTANIDQETIDVGQL
jgi:hypothetical protein